MEKKEKDLQQCSVLIDIARPDELKKIIQEYRLSKDARKAINIFCVDAGIAVGRDLF